jgi:hypothetical protein
LIVRAQEAATALESAWCRWRNMHGLTADPAPAVSSYVGFSLDAPWGQPRIVFGICAEEAEQLATLLDRHDCVGPVHASVKAKPVGSVVGSRPAEVPVADDRVGDGSGPDGSGPVPDDSAEHDAEADHAQEQSQPAAQAVPATQPGFVHIPAPSPASGDQQPLAASASSRSAPPPAEQPDPRPREAASAALTSQVAPQRSGIGTPIALAASRAVNASIASRRAAAQSAAAQSAAAQSAAAAAEGATEGGASSDLTGASDQDMRPGGDGPSEPPVPPVTEAGAGEPTGRSGLAGLDGSTGLGASNGLNGSNGHHGSADLNRSAREQGSAELDEPTRAVGSDGLGGSGGQRGPTGPEGSAGRPGSHRPSVWSGLPDSAGSTGSSRGSEWPGPLGPGSVVGDSVLADETRIMAVAPESPDDLGPATDHRAVSDRRLVAEPEPQERPEPEAGADGDAIGGPSDSAAPGLVAFRPRFEATADYPVSREPDTYYGNGRQAPARHSGSPERATSAPDGPPTGGYDADGRPSAGYNADGRPLRGASLTRLRRPGSPAPGSGSGVAAQDRLPQGSSRPQDDRGRVSSTAASDAVAWNASELPGQAAITDTAV